MDFRHSRLHVRRSYDDRAEAFRSPKGGTTRLVPLTHDANAEFTAMERGRLDALVFGDDEGQPSHQNSLVRALERAAAKA